MLKAGYFQTFEYPSSSSVLIHDEIYGDHLITEPVLVALLHSPALLRLQGVCQHGITGLLGHTHRVTRLEHSVGAFLVVRTVGSSVDEQAAALLHDISHTALSHVVDWALSKPGEESYHEVHKERAINMNANMAGIPRILKRHGLDSARILDESIFPLVEKSAPHLCADRLDYALRDSVGFGKLELHDARRVFSSVRAFPDVSHPTRLLVLDDVDLSLRLARAYLEADRDVWSNRAHIDMYRRTGQVIGDIIKQGGIKEEELWKCSDQEFWELLRSVAGEEGAKVMECLEQEGLPDEDGLTLPQRAKVRTIDPDVYVGDHAVEPVPLSGLLPLWAAERQMYILQRETTRADAVDDNPN
ncbi:uncharacterized protein APUU_50207S [Aspergillus puulaauensis]|uniref:HD/PDEase domain-containing protein n=1 Tax=Aspergillus puulaauensis TaxID=1220207 RepID=A0A7R8ANK0_9EURO|nr:uncharacterized protein APUU_50207S [Aspergillus puulaauensis]BCS25496.1 hypothetical protein APUU_50207S [Aspergillus puulaauensis]